VEDRVGKPLLPEYLHSFPILYRGDILTNLMGIATPNVVVRESQNELNSPGFAGHLL
jgi:hypothetical protein